MKVSRPAARRGSIMVTLLLLLSVLAMLVATVATESLQTLKTASQSGRDSQAKYAAYAGMETVMNELRKDPKYHGNPTVNSHHGRKDGTLSELNQVKYEVLIWNNMQDGSDATSSSSKQTIDGPGDIKVQPDTVYMVSTGLDQIKGQEVVLTSMAGTARRVRPVFEDAAFARSKIMVESDTLVDAWDSQGGWVGYVGGKFPDPGANTDPDDGSGGGGGGGQGNSNGNGNGNGMEAPPTVKNFEATLGTDNPGGRTMRLLGSSKLNGYFRVGPGSGAAFSADSGSSSGGSSAPGGVRPGSSNDDSTSAPTYGVATATSPENQIAGQKGVSAQGKFAKVDDQTTEMPQFVAPYDADDLSPPPRVNNQPGEREERQWDGSVIKVPTPPPPVRLDPGGYESIEVPGNQTLELSPGVYYFKEGMNVSGKIKLSGSDPVIVFVGEKAVFTHAEINKDGKTSSLQLCFTDEITDETELDTLLSRVSSFFDPATTSTSSQTDNGNPITGTGTSAEAAMMAMLTPMVDPQNPTAGREGASLLEITGGEFHGSISGKNLVTLSRDGNIFGAMMANIISMKGGALHQDLALKGSNLMNAGGWTLEGVHQLR